MVSAVSSFNKYPLICVVPWLRDVGFVFEEREDDEVGCNSFILGHYESLPAR